MMDAKPLSERMRYQAQNSEMIDQHFTESGKLLNEGAGRIIALESRVAELEKALQELVTHVDGFNPNRGTNSPMMLRARAALRSADKAIPNDNIGHVSVAAEENGT